MAKIVKISGDGRKHLVEKNLNPETAREMANQMRRGHAPGSSTQYRVVADETPFREIR